MNVKMKSTKKSEEKFDLETENTKENILKNSKTQQNSNDDSFMKLKQKAVNTVKNSIDFAATSSQKIERTIKEGIKKTKESSMYQEIQEKSNQLKTIDQKDKNKFKRKLVRGLVKIKDVIFKLLEEFVGRIKIGTQYGKSNIDVLADLAKLKELGIISEKEFESKKKEILERI